MSQPEIRDTSSDIGSSGMPSSKRKIKKELLVQPFLKWAGGKRQLFNGTGDAGVPWRQVGLCLDTLYRAVQSRLVLDEEPTTAPERLR